MVPSMPKNAFIFKSVACTLKNKGSFIGTNDSMKNLQHPSNLSKSSLDF